MLLVTTRYTHFCRQKQYNLHWDPGYLVQAPYNPWLASCWLGQYNPLVCCVCQNWASVVCNLWDLNGLSINLIIERLLFIQKQEICKQERQRGILGGERRFADKRTETKASIIETFYIVFSCQNFKFTRCFIVVDICGLSLNAPSPTNSQPQPGTIIKVAKFKTDLKLPRVKFCNENYILSSSRPRKAFRVHKTNFSAERVATFLYSRLNYHIWRAPFYFLQGLKVHRI